MGKTTLYTAVTLDGYIAKSDGSVAFLDDAMYQLPDEDYGYRAFYDSIDVVLMGYNTYKQISNFEIDYPYACKKSIVISSHSEVAVSEEGVVISTDPAEDVLRKLRLGDQNIWIIGGGATNARVHEAGLIDEMILTYLPITLGAGIPLFRSNNATQDWKNIGSRSFPNGLVQITLARK